MRVTRQLRLEPERHEITVGAEVTVRVRDDRRRPVAGAIVETETKSARTDERGLCRLRFDAPGFWKLVAAKSSTDRVAFEPGSALVRVVPTASRRRPRRLAGSR